MFAERHIERVRGRELEEQPLGPDQRTVWRDTAARAELHRRRPVSSLELAAGAHCHDDRKEAQASFLKTELAANLQPFPEYNPRTGLSFFWP